MIPLTSFRKAYASLGCALPLLWTLSTMLSIRLTILVIRMIILSIPPSNVIIQIMLGLSEECFSQFVFHERFAIAMIHFFDFWMPHRNTFNNMATHCGHPLVLQAHTRTLLGCVVFVCPYCASMCLVPHALHSKPIRLVLVLLGRRSRWGEALLIINNDQCACLLNANIVCILMVLLV